MIISIDHCCQGFERCCACRHGSGPYATLLIIAANSGFMKGVGTVFWEQRAGFRAGQDWPGICSLETRQPINNLRITIHELGSTRIGRKSAARRPKRGCQPGKAAWAAGPFQELPCYEAGSSDSGKLLAPWCFVFQRLFGALRV